MTQKIALITGATSGIGRITALELLKLGWHVVVAVRNSSVRDSLLLQIKQESSDPLNLTFIDLDLSNLLSVQQCAKDFWLLAYL